MSASHDFSERTLSRLLDDLARFSAEGPGVTRFAYDAHWREARRWLDAEARARGLEATPDAAGNLLLHDPALRPGDSSRPVLMVGSHLDTVKHGGRYDGAYGAVAGLMLAAAHRGKRGTPVVGFVTCEEEQSRFDGPMIGARSLLGLASAGELDRVRDGDGVTWRAALEEVRAAGLAAPLAAGGRPFAPLFRPRAEIELHIEQGPVLETEGLDLGIVSHVAGYRRVRATLAGEARHAGTTPLALRHDALVAAAELVLAVESLARETGGAAAATAGNLRVEPGLYNVVPGGCEAWIEMRHVEEAKLDAMQSKLEERGREIAARRGVAVELGTVTRQAPVGLSKDLAERAEALARERGISYRAMHSGAGHDSMEFARAGTPSLMLFVPSRGGVSHSPDEHSEPADLWRGVEFASALLARLAGDAA